MDPALRPDPLERAPRGLKIGVTVLWVLVVAGILIERFAWNMTAEIIGIGLVAVAGIPAFVISHLGRQHDA